MGFAKYFPCPYGGTGQGCGDRTRLCEGGRVPHGLWLRLYGRLNWHCGRMKTKDFVCVEGVQFTGK